MTPTPEPRRLLDDDDATARLLAAANRDYETDGDEVGAWRRLRSRLEPNSSRQWPWWGAAAAAVGGVLLLWRLGHPPPSRALEVAREPPRPVAELAAPPPAPAVARDPHRSAPARPRSAPRPAPPAVDCDQAPAELEPADAARCLAKRAAQPGLTGERALVELATLRRQRLNDVPGAIAVLREHRARFPDGVLRGEVDFALVELLPQAGRVEEALAETARLLDKPWGRSRTSELRLTRARLYQDRLGDCSRAIPELTPIQNEFGAVGDEAEFRLAQCLEQLGELTAAARAFGKYLERPAARQAQPARERLEALGASPSPSESP